MKNDRQREGENKYYMQGVSQKKTERDQRNRRQERWPCVESKIETKSKIEKETEIEIKLKVKDREVTHAFAPFNEYAP